MLRSTDEDGELENAVQLPVKTLQEKTAEQSKHLRIQFPVSSGQQHRKTESEWVPVSPKKDSTCTALVPLKGTPSIPAQAGTPPIETSVFPVAENNENLDIGSIVSQRLTAMRKLQENPHDVQALNEMYKAQKSMQNWAESKQQPGMFTGSTGVKVLSAAELSSGFQAWAKKFIDTNPHTPRGPVPRLLPAPTRLISRFNSTSTRLLGPLITPLGVEIRIE
uniref:Uncharacterized protein n=1 Tax=Timema tahoe TaxID=61484 RepID=A0A7R9IHU8_9NEOP|nr:unnamed protein product [Timema tahoe]